MGRVWVSLRLLVAIGVAVSASNVVCAQSIDEPADEKASAAAAPRASGKTGRRHAKSSPSAAAAGDPERALEAAHKALATRKFDAAAGLADNVLKATSKDGRATARALFVRGEARLGQSRPADAIADLNAALWVKNGLSPTEAAAAEAARNKAFGLVGLTAPGGKTAAEPQPALASVADPLPPPAQPRPARQARSGTWSTDAIASQAQTAPPAPDGAGSGSGIGSFFANLFSGAGAGSSKPQSGTGASGETVLPSAGSSGRYAATSSAPAQWAQGIEIKPASSGVESRQRPAGAAKATTSRHAAHQGSPAHASKGRGYAIQLAAVRTQNEAKALAETVKRTHSHALGGREFYVAEATFGNMGRFYRVEFGGFASLKETRGLCASIRSSGNDCIAVER